MGVCPQPHTSPGGVRCKGAYATSKHIQTYPLDKLPLQTHLQWWLHLHSNWRSCSSRCTVCPAWALASRRSMYSTKQRHPERTSSMTCRRRHSRKTGTQHPSKKPGVCRCTLLSRYTIPHGLQQCVMPALLHWLLGLPTLYRLQSTECGDQGITPQFAMHNLHVHHITCIIPSATADHPHTFTLIISTTHNPPFYVLL